MEVKVTFICETKTTQVLCSVKDEMKTMFQKFINKFNSESEIKDYKFYYEGKQLEYNSTIEKNESIGDKKEITITVQKNIRIIKCPICNYNDCIINLSDFKIALYGCEHNHSHFTNYDNYEQTQKMEFSKIRCCNCDPVCNNNQQNDPLDFYLCLTCSKFLGNSKSYCNKCNSTHISSHKKVKFSNKNYYCKNHFNKFIKYCFKCKKNLCEDCVNTHEKHNIKSYETMAPNDKELNELKTSLELIKTEFETLKLVINDIIYSLNGTMRLFQNYYDIAANIIGKYELFNKDFKNFTILESLSNLKNSNFEIMKELEFIKNQKDIRDKAISIINIYKNKKDNYKRNMNQIDLKEKKDDLPKEVYHDKKSKNHQKKDKDKKNK